MDSEKHQEVQELIKNGRHPNDEGPYYHHTFWESYKGSIKGKLGGLAVGGLAGAIVGTVILAAATMAGIPGLSAWAVIGGLTAAGMMYGKDEFSEVGRITGAVASAGKDAESRMKEFEKSKFNELKQDINELKSMVSGKPVEQIAREDKAKSAAIVAKELEKEQKNYRVTHHDPSIPKPKNNGLIFWKVALVGLVVGAAVGLILFGVGSLTGATAMIEGTKFGMLASGKTAAAITGGVIGASFGINRDIFRRIFDKTDLLFKGSYNFTNGITKQQEPEQAINASKEQPEVKTLVSSGIEYPTSDTFHRDQLVARANQVLAAMDHTTASRH